MGIIDEVSDKIQEKREQIKERDAEKQDFDPNITFNRQEVEYKVVEIDRKLAGVLSTEAKNPEVKMNRMAAEGWRLVETINEDNGGTQYLVFERESKPYWREKMSSSKDNESYEWTYYELSTDDDDIEAVMLDDGPNEAIFEIDENGAYPRSESTVEEYGVDWVNQATEYLEEEFSSK